MGNRDKVLAGTLMARRRSKPELGKYRPMAHYDDKGPLDEPRNFAVIERIQVALRPEQASLWMIDAQQRFGTRETFASKVDFRLVPDLKPIQIQSFNRPWRNCRPRWTGKFGAVAKVILGHASAHLLREQTTL